MISDDRLPSQVQDLSQILEIFRAMRLSYAWPGRVTRRAVEFKGAHFPKNVILHAVFFYIRYPVSYRELQEILAERDIQPAPGVLTRPISR
jgi:putative transposase